MKKTKLYHILLLAGLAIVLVWLQSCRSQNAEKETPHIVIVNSDGGGFTIELDFLKGKAHHYPLMAAWIEDAQGNYIQTLFVARSVARGEYEHATAQKGQWTSGPLRRAATLPYWAHKYNTVAQNEDVYPSPKNPVPDAYSGATPTGSFLLKAKTDNKINAPFRVLFEINQFFDFNDFWTNNKFPDDQDYKTSGQPALVYASDLIEPVYSEREYALRLIGHSHYAGSNGTLFTSLNTITTAGAIVQEIKVRIR
jgi:hypothetical protein